jgi:hypothetical protein
MAFDDARHTNDLVRGNAQHAAICRDAHGRRAVRAWPPWGNRYPREPVQNPPDIAAGHTVQQQMPLVREEGKGQEPQRWRAGGF